MRLQLRLHHLVTKYLLMVLLLSQSPTMKRKHSHRFCLDYRPQSREHEDSVQRKTRSHTSKMFL